MVGGHGMVPRRLVSPATWASAGTKAPCGGWWRFCSTHRGPAARIQHAAFRRLCRPARRGARGTAGAAVAAGGDRAAGCARAARRKPDGICAGVQGYSPASAAARVAAHHLLSRLARVAIMAAATGAATAPGRLWRHDPRPRPACFIRGKPAANAAAASRPACHAGPARRAATGCRRRAGRPRPLAAPVAPREGPSYIPQTPGGDAQQQQQLMALQARIARLRVRSALAGISGDPYAGYLDLL